MAKSKFESERIAARIESMEREVTAQRAKVTDLSRKLSAAYVDGTGTDAIESDLQAAESKLQHMVSALKEMDRQLVEKSDAENAEAWSQLKAETHELYRQNYEILDGSIKALRSKLSKISDDQTAERTLLRVKPALQKAAWNAANDRLSAVYVDRIPRRVPGQPERDEHGRTPEQRVKEGLS